tara:strand:- start:3700 stop:4965 length:1266 start_codon:yes stop_codon:yes gene_type:complete
MASTIKIKNGTSGAPSSLAQGELAININNGSLFFGTENSSLISSSFTFSHVTASGIIKAEHLFSTDDIEATDDITAGGKVQASLSDGFHLGGTQAIYADGGVFHFGAAGANSHIDGADIELDATGDIDFDAAGNDVKFSKAGTTRLTVNTLRGDITASGGITSSGDISTGGHITASGNISSSGIISANTTFKTQNGNVISSFGTATIIANTNGSTQIQATELQLNTTSGDIKFMDSSTNQLQFDLDGTSGEIIIQLKVDSDDLVFKQYDGTEVLRIGDDATISATKNKFTVTGDTDGTHQGDVVYFGGTTSMTTGAIYHYKSDGTWELADADAASTSDGLLAVALGAASDTNGMLLRGMVTLDHDPGAVGDVLYLSTTAGDATATAPSGNNDIVRIIGYCLHASNGQIWFDPDKTFVEVTA